MMKRYKAYATMGIDLVCTFEIPEDVNPMEYARELDGGDFKEIDGTGDWKVYEIEEA
jgi:hypothetical protein